MSDAPPRPAGSHRRHALPLVLGVGLALALVPAACSTGGSSEDISLPSGITVIDDFVGTKATGDTCRDATGDLETNDGGTTAQPAGIDIVDASASVGNGTMHLEFVTAGPISSATNPLFVLQQGDITANLEKSFEVHLTSEGGKPWTATLKRFTKAGEVANPPKVSGRITADGNKLVADLPTAELPPVATAIWQFGSSSGVASQARVIDLCQPFATPGAPGSTVAGGTVTTTDRNIAAAVGTPATAPGGTRVTVRQVVVPAQANRTVTATALPGSRLAAVEAEVCAGSRGAEQVSDRQFSVQTPDGRGRAVWAAPDHTNDPQFNAGVTLRPDECTSGWITFEIPEGDPISAVTYDTSSQGSGPFIVFANP